MKDLTLLLLLSLPLVASAQDQERPKEIDLSDEVLLLDLVPAKPEEVQLSQSEIDKAVADSSKVLKSIVGEEEFKKFGVVGINVEIAKTSLLGVQSHRDGDVTTALERIDSPVFSDCTTLIGSAGPLVTHTIQTNDILQRMEDNSRRVNGGFVYIMWGYHRGVHTDTDVTFNTPDGTFTIHDAQGVDRQSSGLMTYINPMKMSQPQYNLRIGYRFKNNWAIEVGNDHMKWVFVPNQNYEVTGNYDREVAMGGQLVPFQEAVDANRLPLAFEHTDGYNYINANVLKEFQLLSLFDESIRLDATAGVGIGAMITKTRTQFNDDIDADGQGGKYRDLDAPFKLAGWGANVSGGLKLSYVLKNGKELFLRGEVRGVYSKINNAPFFNTGTIEHTGMFSMQRIIGAGIAVPLGQNKKKKKKKERENELTELIEQERLLPESDE